MQSTPSYGAASKCKSNAGWFQVSQSYERVHTPHYTDQQPGDVKTICNFSHWDPERNVSCPVGWRAEPQKLQAHSDWNPFHVFLVNNVTHPALKLLEFFFSNCRTFEVLKCVEIYEKCFPCVYFAERKQIKMSHSRSASPLDRLWVVRLFPVSSTPLRASTKSSGRLDASRLSPDSALPWRQESKSETVPSCSVIRCIGRKAWREGQTRSTVERTASTRAAALCLHHHPETSTHVSVRGASMCIITKGWKWTKCSQCNMGRQLHQSKQSR